MRIELPSEWIASLRRNQRFVGDDMAGLRILLGFSMIRVYSIRFDSFTTHFFHIHGHISYFPI